LHVLSCESCTCFLGTSDEDAGDRRLATLPPRFAGSSGYKTGSMLIYCSWVDPRFSVKSEMRWQGLGRTCIRSLSRCPAYCRLAGTSDRLGPIEYIAISSPLFRWQRQPPAPHHRHRFSAHSDALPRARPRGSSQGFVLEICAPAVQWLRKTRRPAPCQAGLGAIGYASRQAAAPNETCCKSHVLGH
jgi:hypothetical protein